MEYSVCCSEPSMIELDSNNIGMCSDCKEWSLFEKEEIEYEEAWDIEHSY